MAPTPDFKFYPGFQCYQKRKPILGAGNGWFVSTAATKELRKDECMAKCLEHETCESITANQAWAKCFIGGWGAERKEVSANWLCYERIMTDVYSFTIHKNTQCNRWNPKKLQRKVEIEARQGKKPSEIRACLVECANDDECDGVSNVWNKCFFQYGGGLHLNAKAKNKHTCYEKTLSTVSKAQVCWRANNLGICDKAYGTDTQSECETDFAVNGFGFDGAETGSKFCKYLARTMNNYGKSWAKEVHPVSKLTSLANLCGELCPSKTTWTYVGKKCTSNNLNIGKVLENGSQGAKDFVNNFSMCLAKCAANVACKGVTRRNNQCIYQSKVETTDLKQGDGKWHCYMKN